jgi:hypothetical protein
MPGRYTSKPTDVNVWKFLGKLLAAGETFYKLMVQLQQLCEKNKNEPKYQKGVITVERYANAIIKEADELFPILKKIMN